ncbi:MAG: hypothetical protein A3F70_05025 [Acidobacteria bacterium RIFCSPLOWO2_12_FULL_67_14]|nr:MAG: hypothetical protein A3H29_02555 [Acidobacteria bacterium RIFCSPLOWO2_02_FULL_67_21]OFW37815.1 MAG: hypothetical protein A3F70_05025 [Acidobacteria bacterium RIFCSPLOWO2_12_FULL_67_14]
MRRPRVSRPLLLTATVLVIGAVAVLLLRHGAEPAIRLAQAARGSGSTGVVLFVVAYVVSTVAMLPGSVLTLAAGFAYGPLWGVAVASPASVAGATAAFLLGRTLLRGWAERRIRASTQARAIDSAVEREGFKLVLLLRLSPLIPFDVLNYVLSLSRIRLGTYVLASFVGMLPGTVLYVYLGSLAATAAEIRSPGTDGGPARIVLYIGGLVATVAGVVVATRAARRALASELPGTG